jgi:hypothetical protein
MPKQQKKRGRNRTQNNDPLVKKPTALGDEKKDYSSVRFRDEEPEEKKSKVQFVEPKSTWKILEQARQQQLEENPVAATEYDNNFPALSALGGKNNAYAFSINSFSLVCRVPARYPEYDPIKLYC